MKLKTVIASIGILMITIFSLSFLKAADSSIVKFLFWEKFQTLKIKNKLRIIRIKKADDFHGNLIVCKPVFYVGKKGVQEYYLEDPKAINKIGIIEYVFEDTLAARNAYRIAYNYAEFTRKLARDHYGELCDDSWLTRIFYASKDGSHVYLYTMYYNFQYKINEFSVDAIIQHDKRILLGEFYREMTEDR